jgi:virginiamycin B lyase
MTTAGTTTEYTACCTPQGITSGPDGALWFGLSNGIGRIATDGSFKSYPLPSCCPGVQAVTPGPDGALWFTEGGCCGPTGSRIGRITTAGVITEFAQMANSNPAGIVAGRDGALWFTEQSGNRIGRITTTGVIVEFPVPSCCGVQAITAGQDGALWFTEPNANKIGRITMHGVITEYPLPTPNSGPFGITGGPDGAVWFTEQAGNRFGRISVTPPGTSDAVIIEYPLTNANSMPTGITSGPDGALWFGQANAIGRAAACGLGQNVTFASGNLNIAFDLGISKPASFGTYLIEGSTIKKLWSLAIPAVDPPRAFTYSITGFPPSGSVAVFSLISTTPTGLTCYDLQLVDTGAKAATATPAMLERARRAIRESGLLNTLPEP